jgi:co-chaperonin GroES (HSP10)
MARPSLIKKSMSIKFKPAKGTVVVEIIQKSQTESGIFIPQNATEADLQILAACAEDFTAAKPGDRILIRNNSDCQTLKVDDGKTYLVFKEDAILGVYL